MAGLTILQERHREAFSRLDPEEVEYVWDQVTNRWQSDVRRWTADCRAVPRPPESGSELFEMCRDIGLDQCRVILSFAGENGRARPVIEKLMGHGIVPWAASVEAATEEAARSPRGTGAEGGTAAEGAGRRPLRSPEDVYKYPMRLIGTDTRFRKKIDPRIVQSVKNNPHREGTNMHAWYEHWCVGKTVSSCIENGLTPRSVRRDVRRGYVTLHGFAPDPKKEPVS